MSFWYRAKNVVRVVRLQGLIKDGKGDYINIRKLEKSIDKAFDCKKVKPRAVCLEINSQGGSPVQSSLIYERIRGLSKERDVPVMTFTEDFALSGGYWLSLAADEIYVNPCSIVGSIGILIATFGIHDAIAKLGIDRRVYTPSIHKLKLDIFQPRKESDEVWAAKVMEELLHEFVEVVKERRPGLQKEHPTMFHGDTFTGKEALKIGLVDGVVGDPREIIHKKFGKDVVIQRPPEPFIKRLMSNYVQMSSVQSHQALNSFAEGLQEAKVEAR